MNILDTMADPKLFAPWFTPAADWHAWRCFLSALFGLAIDSADLSLFGACTGRNVVPSEAAREAWVIAGRRGGKSLIAALIAVYASCFRDYGALLKAGERGTFMVLAADRKQARVVMRYVVGFLESVPMLARMIERRTEETIDLTNNVTIEIHTSSFRAVRGYTLIGAACDEIAFWRDESSANPDVEIIAALRPGMATIPGALLVCISSPYARRGALWNAYSKHYGHNGDPVLIWQAPSKTMHPALPDHVIEAAYAEDAASAAAEYGAQFRRDIEAFVSAEAIDAAVSVGRLELPFVRGFSYVAFCDPSGGSVDSMTLGIAHRDGERAVLDLIREECPLPLPFSPEAVVKKFSATLKAYGLAEVRGDRYGAEWVSEAFQREGIRYKPAERTKSEIYCEFLPALNSNRVELLDHKKLRVQLLGLERRTARSGKDSVDHAPGGHDDVVNAAAGALTLVASAAKRQLVRRVGFGAGERIVDAVTGARVDMIENFGPCFDVKWEFIDDDDESPRVFARGEWLRMPKPADGA